MAQLTRSDAFTVLPAARLNAYADEIERIATAIFGNLTNTAAPLFRVRRTSDKIIPNNDFTILDWQTADDDPDGMWDPGTPEFIGIRTPGVWTFQGAFRISAQTGFRINEITLNSTNSGVTSTAVMANTQIGRDSGYGNVVPISWTARLDEGDIIRNYAFQTSGVTLTLPAAQNPAGCSLAGFWIGP